MLPILLASSSPYRRELLQKLAAPFTWQAPDIDESPLINEQPAALVQRLALEKARAIRPSQPSWVIGSDQVAVCGEHILTKPHTFERAFEQLSLMSANKVQFVTGLCLLNSKDDTFQVDVEVVTVFFRKLSDAMIKAYLDLEKPFDCAASFKFEAHGICLIEHIEARDPHAIIGLPLIRLLDMFATAGVDITSYWKLG